MFNLNEFLYLIYVYLLHRLLNIFAFHTVPELHLDEKTHFRRFFLITMNDRIIQRYDAGLTFWMGRW